MPIVRIYGLNVVLKKWGFEKNFRFNEILCINPK